MSSAENNNKATQRDAETSSSLKNLQGKVVLGKICIAAGFIGMGACVFFDFMIGAVLCVILFILGGASLKGSQEKIKEVAGSEILEEVLANTFEDASYGTFEYLNTWQVESANFDFAYDDIEGHDYTHGTYKGLDIELSDINLVSYSTDSDGHRSESSVFHGLWLICDFGREFVANVCMNERSALGKKLGRKGLQTENEAFNRQFNITAEDEEAALRLLTPKLMDSIVAMDANANAKSNFSFLQNGKLHIALNTGRGAFDLKGTMSDAEKIRKQFSSDLNNVLGLIDEIREMDELFM